MSRVGDAHARYRLRASSKALREIVDGRSICDVSLRSAPARSLFLFAEGGPGDEIRFSTMYGELANLFDKVTITCEPRLFTLLERSYPNIHFCPVMRFRRALRRDVPKDRDEIKDAALRQFINHDSLQHSSGEDLVGTTLDALADMRSRRSDFEQPSLLKANPMLVSSIGERMGKKCFRVGLAWRSMLRSSARDRHYFQPEDFRPLAELAGVDFWVLQAGVDSEEIDKLRSVLPNVCVADDIDLIDDFEGQAALLSNMDAVIAPFTSMAELAGALGRPTIMLSNSHQTTWRRNPDGRDVWFSSGKIVGADSVGDRVATIREAVAVLADLQRANINAVSV